MTVSTLTVVPEALASGTAPYAEPDPIRLTLLARSSDTTLQALARAARDDFPDWLQHVRPAASCKRPIRLAGTMNTVEAATGRLLSTVDTRDMPDGVLYKPCGNRRESMCPSCSARYKGDAYQIVRSLLVGGNGVPETVATHPAVFVTFTAPSFGEVHTRVVRKHTCAKRKGCDCRPEPCHARRDQPLCPHGRRLGCFARHDPGDKSLGTPLCLDCYQHNAQVVWNLASGELWRRTTIAIHRYLRRVARRLGVPGNRIRLCYGKAAKYQARGVIHFHAVIRLDGVDPDDKTAIIAPPPGIGIGDRIDAVEHAARVTAFTTDPHPTRPGGWPIAWGEQLDVRPITVAASGQVTDLMAAAYVAKYATKSTEVTGHVSGRLNDETVNLYADPDGTHTERLIEACWILGGPRDWRALRRRAHMLGFAGHFLTKSRSHPVTFQLQRNKRVVFRRAETTGPTEDTTVTEAPTLLVVNFLQFVGSGWHTTADAILANTSAALARDHQTLARQQIADLTG